MNEVKMNKNKIYNVHFFVSAMVFITMVLMASSCKKADNTYRDYKNTAGNFKGNAIQYLQSQPGVYDSLLLVLSRLPRIADVLSKDSVTLFAVSNRSFNVALDNINQARHDSIPAMPSVSIAEIDSAILDQFLCRYILQGKHVSDEIVGFADGLLFQTIPYVNQNGTDTTYSMHMQYAATNASGYVGGGPKSVIYSDTKGSIFYRNWIRVNTITVNINTLNAIVNLLPPGHDFGFGDEFVRAVNFR